MRSRKLVGLAAAVGAGGAAAALALATASCSSGASGGTADAGPKLLDPSCTSGGLSIKFNPMYSAFDGTHTFQVPAVVFGTDQPVTWFVDSTVVGMQVDQELPNEVLLTMLRGGTPGAPDAGPTAGVPLVTTIHVQSADGKCGSAPLTIDGAYESDWEIGSMRYNDGVSAHLSGPPKQGTGSPLESQGMVGPACTTCHGETATSFEFTDVSHTPEQTGGFSDEDLINIIVNGTFPPGAYFDWSIVAYPVWMNFHRWADIQPDQQKGIITYLRSLTPEPQKGAPNFGIVDMPPEDGGGDGAAEPGSPGTDGSADGATDGALDAAGEAGEAGDAGATD